MKTILITGAGRGLGLEMARQYAALGDWHVIATCRTLQAAARLKGIVPAPGGRLESQSLDVADQRSIASLAVRLEGRPIDVLVNNAGVFTPVGERLGTIDAEAFLDVLRVNTVAPLKIVEALLPNLLAGTRRLVAVVSSRMGSIDDNTSGGHYAYRASKAAVNMVIRSLSHDLKDQRVIAVALSPGWARTDMGGPHAPLSPEQSVSRMRAVMEKAGPAQSGHFLDQDGSVIPW